MCIGDNGLDLVLHGGLRYVRVGSKRTCDRPKSNACVYLDQPSSVRDLEPYAMEVVPVEAGEEEGGDAWGREVARG